MNEKFKINSGSPEPLGVSKHSNSFNFAIFSKDAPAISFLLFRPNETTAFLEIPLDPQTNKTGDIWHITIFDLPPNYHYSYRIDQTLLLDPYAKQIITNCGVVYPFKYFNWENDQHPNIPLKDLIIYEMHVRGFTQDSSSNVSKKGSFTAIVEKIPHLKSLGINAVELMPIFEFDERGNANYWGYSTTNFFSPAARYGNIEEFKTLVKALHKNGIEVILDVVYNHTSEGNENGPTQSFKGLANSTYYMLTPNGAYYNFSGCGNTLNCNNPVVQKFILDSLRYWVTEMHVDGFRFDLASILTRAPDGTPLEKPPLIEMITLDPILSKTKLIAEPWDAGGLYQVGSFPGKGVWAEWNGKYRDAVRRFIKGTDGASNEFATRLFGSEDLYGKDCHPHHSINFVTAHDGFSLRDLVSYNEKHNDENGEENRDGDNNNESWNCGVEGQSDVCEIEKLRIRQMKNFILTLMISQGVPMILMGDEYGHTKLGNNNAWAIDSKINWFQWDALNENHEIFEFYKQMIAFRKKHPILTHPHFLKETDATWHGLEPNQPNWGVENRLVAYSLPNPIAGYTLYIAFNAYHTPITVKLPKTETSWELCAYTEQKKSEHTFLKSEEFTLAPYSALILKS